MRPINLIPEDQRRSYGTTTRTGPLAYLIVGALVVLLGGIVMLVLTSNQISERKSEVTTLEGERAAASAQAEKLAPYVSFQQLSESRTQTVGQLADARFDWVRVIRQLSLVLPSNVYLTSLTASSGGGEGIATVPSMQLAGCAPTQDTVAAFVASLKEIDGVTRVGLENSTTGGEKEGEESQSGGEGGSEDSESGCQAAGVYVFGITVVFDGAPPSPDSGTFESTEVAPEAEAAPEGESSTEGEAESSETTGSETSTQAASVSDGSVG